MEGSVKVTRNTHVTLLGWVYRFSGVLRQCVITKLRLIYRNFISQHQDIPQHQHFIRIPDIHPDTGTDIDMRQ